MKKERKDSTKNSQSRWHINFETITDELRSLIQKDAAEEGVGNLMADGAVNGLFNAYKDSVDTDPLIDAAYSTATDVTDSSPGNSTTGTTVPLLFTPKLCLMYLKALSQSHKQTPDFMHYEPVHFF